MNVYRIEYQAGEYTSEATVQAPSEAAAWAFVLEKIAPPSSELISINGRAVFNAA